MKAILIDVTAQTVTDIEILPGLNALYAAIDCDCVCRIVIDERNDIWLDDVGLLHKPQPPKFMIGSYPNPLAGNAIITGYTSEGDTISTTFQAAQIRPFIKFLGDVHEKPEIIVSDWKI